MQLGDCLFSTLAKKDGDSETIEINEHDFSFLSFPDRLISKS